MVATIDIFRPALACPLAPEFRGAVAVIGNLDGVHKGHQALLVQGAQLAKQMQQPLAAIIFDPHPRKVFAPDAEPFLLNSTDQKADYLVECGVEKLFILPFNRHLSMLSPEEFVKVILQQNLGLSAILAGEEFQFGQKRAGTVEHLKEYGELAGLVVKITDLAMSAQADEKYSSSLAREALRNGAPEMAADILGRPWAIRGLVTKGKQLGRRIGFPTANIEMGDYLHPAKGVYAVTVVISARVYQGVANFGARPTVDGNGVLLEVHLFNFDQDIYGEKIEVSFHKFLRPEQKFANLDALKEQISKDSQHAATFLAQM